MEPGAGKLRQFKAVWHPQREDVFIIGSRKQPYRVNWNNLLSSNEEIDHHAIDSFNRLSCMMFPPAHSFINSKGIYSLDSSTSINLFHPTAPVFAACNFGEIFIFRS